jgi:uncharacterized DUF497 family protein
MPTMLASDMDFFEWDLTKESQNISKHGVDFETAKQAFRDPKRIIAVDEAHSKLEPRYFCIGMIVTGVITVRFTMRGKHIRII